jgi:hypothetical protein
MSYEHSVCHVIPRQSRKVLSRRLVRHSPARPDDAEVSRLPEKADLIRSSALTVRSSNRSQRFCVIRYHQTLQFHQRRETS